MAWRNALICGLVASAAVVGCKVTVNDCSNGGCFEDSGAGGTTIDAGTGGTKELGGSGGASGSAGSGGTSGASGSAGAGGTAGSGGVDSGVATQCHPEEDTGKPCAQCIETKCCQEWLDCVNDADCLKDVGSKPAEFTCIQDCLVNVDSGVMTLEECAGNCQHDTVGVSAATSSLIACTRDTGDSGTTQNCTNQCFLRDLP